MARRGALALILALCGAAACLAEPAPEELGESQSAIIGGSPTSDHPAVGMIESTTGLCSGTLVAPAVVLTAAHCVKPSIDSGTEGQGRVSFGPGGGDFFATAGIADMYAHRYYQEVVTSGYDIALIRLEEEVEGVTPLPFNVDPIDESWVGRQVEVVGFGVTDGEAQTGAGVKRQVYLTIDEVGPDHIGIGYPGRNICQGDSGGPAFYEIDGVDTVIAVNSYGSNFCMNRSYGARTDSHADEGLLEVLAAWSGPCPHDGTCDESVDCGEFPDPDCDGCGFDSYCTPGCDRLDLDCPVVGLAGNFCTSNDDCESRLCVPAPEDERVMYCSVPCDPAAGPNGGCEPPLTVCAEGPGGEHYCQFSGMTPGIQGAPCNSGDDCRSGVCHPEQEICIEQCGEGLPECRDPFVCAEVSSGVSACVPDEGGSCACAAPGAGGGGAAGALILLGWLVISRGRRRR